MSVRTITRAALAAGLLWGLGACDPELPTRACGGDDDCFAGETCAAGQCVGGAPAPADEDARPLLEFGMPDEGPAPDLGADAGVDQYAADQSAADASVDQHTPDVGADQYTPDVGADQGVDGAAGDLGGDMAPADLGPPDAIVDMAPPAIDMATPDALPPPDMAAPV